MTVNTYTQLPSVYTALTVVFTSSLVLMIYLYTQVVWSCVTVVKVYDEDDEGEEVEEGIKQMVDED